MTSILYGAVTNKVTFLMMPKRLWRSSEASMFPMVCGPFEVSVRYII